MLKDGCINILFGEVVSIEDVQKICRVRVSINGYTDQLDDDDLPWYFPFYGLNYLPEEGDIVSVLIFDGCISSGFYGRKCGLSNKDLGEDYANYLEIFKRTINGAPVSLTYTESSGIEFVNDDSGIQIEADKLSLFCASNSIVVTESSIVLGNEEYAQASLKGDDVLKILGNMADLMDEIVKLFLPTSDIMIGLMAGCATPFTAAFLPNFINLSVKSQLIHTSIATLSAGIMPALLQSEKVKIE